MRTKRDEDGYAIVAAVGALAVFASVAYAVLAADRGDLAELRGEYAQARLQASADAGLAQAVQALASSDSARRWPIDGQVTQRSFNGDRLSITIEDERGKVPFVGLSSDQLRRLFTGAGAPDARIPGLIDAYQDWFDPNADPARHQQQVARYAARGLQPPEGGGGASVDELARLNDMDAATFAKIRAVLTPYFGVSGAFSPSTASPLAIETMSEEGADDPEVLARQHEIAGERPALGFEDKASMAGRAVTIDVTAEDADGDRLERRTVVEFTGKTSPAFYVRQLD